MTPAAALARARWVLDQPPPPVPAGQLAVDEPTPAADPRPVIPAGQPEPLFDLAEVTR
jgi:hypothetical protein